jgi:hypothetical protein
MRSAVGSVGGLQREGQVCPPGTAHPPRLRCRVSRCSYVHANGPTFLLDPFAGRTDLTLPLPITRWWEDVAADSAALPLPIAKPLRMAEAA